MSQTPPDTTSGIMVGTTFLVLAAACYVTYTQSQEQARIVEKMRRREKRRQDNLKKYKYTKRDPKSEQIVEDETQAPQQEERSQLQEQTQIPIALAVSSYEEYESTVDLERDKNAIRDGLYDDLQLIQVITPSQQQVDTNDSLGGITFQDFCLLYKLIKKYVSSVPSIKLKVHMRRAALKDEDIETYRNLVFEVAQYEDDVHREVMSMVFDHLKLDEDIFFRYEQEVGMSEEFAQVKVKVLQTQIARRVKEAKQLEQMGASPRAVALVAPRDLSHQDVLKIFYREQDLREEFNRDLEETPDEFLLEENVVLNALLFDKLNNEFNIEPEDYHYCVQKHKIMKDEKVMARYLQIEEMSKDLAARFAAIAFCQDNLTQYVGDEELKTPDVTDDLNDRSEDTLLFHSQDMITNSLLENTRLEHDIGDLHLSKILANQDSEMRISQPNPQLSQPPSAGRCNPFISR